MSYARSVPCAALGERGERKFRGVRPRPGSIPRPDRRAIPNFGCKLGNGGQLLLHRDASGGSQNARLRRAPPPARPVLPDADSAPERLRAARPDTLCLSRDADAGTGEQGIRMRRAATIESLEPRRFLSAYFVSPSGSDAAAGSAAAPWRTLQHAADTVAAGDVVTVRPGATSDSTWKPTGRPARASRSRPSPGRSSTRAT